MKVQISDTIWHDQTDKTMFLSKLTHLFLSVPALPTVLQEINSLMFSFLWNNKPDKVKRNNICGDYLNGGLKMIFFTRTGP